MPVKRQPILKLLKFKTISSVKIGFDLKQIVTETILPPLLPKKFQFQEKKVYKILFRGTWSNLYKSNMAAIQINDCEKKAE